MMTAKEIFEFLKPNKWNLILTGILILGISFIWNYVLPETTYFNIMRIPGEELSASGRKLLTRLIAAVIAGLVVISYTLISLIFYFWKGEYKNEK